MLLNDLAAANLIHPPDFLINNTNYLVVMGSHAYGLANENSDLDLYGFCFPRKEMVFPHLRGEIPGFGNQIKRFEQWAESHVIHETPKGAREYDVTVYSIVRFVQLVMENNPNMIDTLFVPQSCVLHCGQAGNLLRDNRKLFLHKGCWHKYKGYAYSQLSKMSSKTPVGKRMELVEKYGYDTKFALHVVRLLTYVEQILTEGDLDLQRNNDQLKSIRRGEWTEDQVREWATAKERQLEEVYNKSTLPWGPPEDEIRDLLMTCLESQYGDLSKVVVREDSATRALHKIRDILQAEGL